MKKCLVILTVVLISQFIIGASAYPAPDNISETFPAKKLVEISTVSGDCIVKTGPGDKITVNIEADVSPADAFRPDMEVRSDRLKLKENWSGSSSGRVVWNITVPKETEIEFSTASGDFSLEGVTKEVEAKTASGDVSVKNAKGEFEIKTASGDIQLNDLEGEFDISTASGDIEASDIEGHVEFSTASGEIEVEDSKGTFELKCASGDIKVTNFHLEEESSFSTASGEVEVTLSNTPQNDISLSSASGDVVLDYNGNPLKGRFELSAKKHGGNIKSSVNFDKEETFEKNGEEYMRKIFTRSGSQPLIQLETASGSAELKE